MQECLTWPFPPVIPGFWPAHQMTTHARSGSSMRMAQISSRWPPSMVTPTRCCGSPLLLMGGCLPQVMGPYPCIFITIIGRALYIQSAYQLTLRQSCVCMVFSTGLTTWITNLSNDWTVGCHAGSADTTVRLWRYEASEGPAGLPKYGAEETSCLEVGFSTLYLHHTEYDFVGTFC